MFSKLWRIFIIKWTFVTGSNSLNVYQQPTLAHSLPISWNSIHKIFLRRWHTFLELCLYSWIQSLCEAQQRGEPTNQLSDKLLTQATGFEHHIFLYWHSKSIVFTTQSRPTQYTCITYYLIEYSGRKWYCLIETGRQARLNILVTLWVELGSMHIKQRPTNLGNFWNLCMLVVLVTWNTFSEIRS